MNYNEDKYEYYRQRKARNVSIGVAGYFIGVACLIGLSVLAPFRGAIIGVVLMLAISAASTGLIIYTRISTPLEYTDRYRMFGGDMYEEERYRQSADCRDVSTDADGVGGSDGGAGGRAGEGGAGGAGGNGGAAGASGAGFRRNGGRNSGNMRMYRQLMEIYWLVVTIIYFVISFNTMRWGITWIIWLIAAALEKALRIFWEIYMDNNNGRQ